MKLTEWIETLDLEISIRFSANQAGPWIANIKNRRGFSVDFKDGVDDVMLRSATGWAKSPVEALSELVKSVKTHSHIVPDSSATERLTLPIQKSLEII